uniref:AlNc14C72G4921 protein n=1 Tax=Albugo laibachii Nc14 TaxID=890382 RepID=F0WE65_9STRA|nr:AlNc14C72G4921 [Albugo laibachii Nc14]|eukprot:CCA19494.1 AlNc14C72G4921 [Albugo laibachii Nc14]
MISSSRVKDPFRHEKVKLELFTFSLEDSRSPSDSRSYGTFWPDERNLSTCQKCISTHLPHTVQIQ